MYATRTKDTEQSARLRENYKIVLRKLWKKRDLETLLFLRVAYETGILLLRFARTLYMENKESLGTT